MAGRYRGWNEYDSVYHLLTAPFIEEETEPFIRDDSFDWDGLGACHRFSHGGRVMLAAGWQLWRGASEPPAGILRFNLADALVTLDEGNASRLVEAIQIYRYGELFG